MTAQNSIGLLRDCAPVHIREHTDRNGFRSFGVYDNQGDPRAFGGGDARIPNLIGARVRERTVDRMFKVPESPEGRLLVSIQDLLSTVDDEPDAFLDMEFSDWMSVMAGVLECLPVKWVRHSTLSKMLHRKRPHLVPIHDSRLRDFYRCDEENLWETVHRDWRANRALLEEWRGEATCPDGRRLSLLRVADMAIWEHESNGCAMSRALPVHDN